MKKPEEKERVMWSLAQLNRLDEGLKEGLQDIALFSKVTANDPEANHIKRQDVQLLAAEFESSPFKRAFLMWEAQATEFSNHLWALGLKAAVPGHSTRRMLGILTQACRSLDGNMIAGAIKAFEPYLDADVVAKLRQTNDAIYPPEER